MNGSSVAGPAGALTYWLVLPPADAGRLPLPLSGPLVWAEQTIARIPCSRDHSVVLERLQPHPARLVEWDVGPVHATARILGEGESIEVTFSGRVRVHFQDAEGEEHRIQKGFQARQEVPVKGLAPHWEVRVLAGGSRGEGGLRRDGRRAGFQGTVHLTALVHVTERVAWRALPGPREHPPWPLTAREAEDESLAPETHSPHGMAASRLPLRVDGFPLPLGPASLLPLDVAGTGSGAPPASEAQHRSLAGEIPSRDGEARAGSGAGQGQGALMLVEGAVQLTPGLRPVSLETRRENASPCLHLRLLAHDGGGDLWQGAYVLDLPEPVLAPGDGVQVLQEEWRVARSTGEGTGQPLEPPVVWHRIWLRLSGSAPQDNPPDERREETMFAQEVSLPLPHRDQRKMEDQEPAGEGEEVSRPSPAEVFVWRLPPPDLPGR